MAQSATMQSESAQRPSLAAKSEMRALLEADRERAGEARRQSAPASLTKADYAPTFEERWYAFRMAHWYWFHGAGAGKVRRGLLRSVLATLLGAALAVGWGWFAPEPPRAEATELASTGSRVAAAEVAPSRAATPVEEPVRAERATAVQSPEPVAPPVVSGEDRTGQEPGTDSKLVRMVQELPPQARVVRADVLLQNPHPLAAQRARGLLESASADGVHAAHLQSSLAEACLRLDDFECAEHAAKQAIRLRPWRGGYRLQLRRVRAAAAQR